jgi:hypothetical protein
LARRSLAISFFTSRISAISWRVTPGQLASSTPSDERTCAVPCPPAQYPSL